jgi:hypothetical protein
MPPRSTQDARFGQDARVQCIHLGPATGELRDCSTCKGVRQKVFQCGHPAHEETTLRECGWCPDFQETITMTPDEPMNPGLGLPSAGPDDNGQVFVPDGLVELVVGDNVWRMDLLGTIRKLDSFKAKMDAAADPYGHLDQLQGLVAAAGGPELNMTQLDWLHDELYRFWVSKKNERKAAIDGELRSQSSTELTP